MYCVSQFLFMYCIAWHWQSIGVFETEARGYFQIMSPIVILQRTRKSFECHVIFACIRMEELCAQDRAYLEMVASCGQERVIARLDTKESSDSGREYSIELTNFIADVRHFESFYPGGLKSYIEKARKMLLQSSQKVNPLAGFTPSVRFSVFEVIRFPRPFASTSTRLCFTLSRRRV